MKRMLPLIGIPMALNPRNAVSGIPENAPFQYVRQSYIDAVIAAGGLPVAVPAFAVDDELELVRHYITMLDGLLLAGGGDPDTALWGETNTHGVNINPLRDSIELELCRRCVASDIPVLGVCRGIQMIAIALDGDIWQDYSLGGFDDHRHGDHDVEIAAGTHLHEIFGMQNMQVNSSHHQIVRKLPADFIVSATSSGDGAVEAIEYAGVHNRWIAGVQWHPETMNESHFRALYGAFIAACTERMR